MGDLPGLFVSVIIPVFNDAKRLKTCLAALENQTYPKNLYEVIVIDNGSDEDDQDIESVVSQFDQAVATCESRPGSYAARNKGISLAKGDVLAFTDSDCIPANNWIEKGVANLLLVPNCGLVAGRVEIFFQDPERPTAAELYDSVFAFPQKSYIENERFGVTANLFTFKSVMDQVGLFNDVVKSGGDGEWGRRVFTLGYRQIYADDTCVAHPGRYSFAQLYKKVSRVIKGQLELTKESKYKTVFNILVEFALDLKPPLRYILSNIRSNQKLTNRNQKTKVVLAALCMKYFKVWQKMQLQLRDKIQRTI